MSLSEAISVSKRCSVLVFSVTVQFSVQFSVLECSACCVLRVGVCVCVDGGL